MAGRAPWCRPLEKATTHPAEPKRVTRWPRTMLYVRTVEHIPIRRRYSVTATGGCGFEGAATRAHPSPLTDSSLADSTRSSRARALRYNCAGQPPLKPHPFGPSLMATRSRRTTRRFGGSWVMVVCTSHHHQGDAQSRRRGRCSIYTSTHTHAHTHTHTHVGKMGALVVNSFMSRRGGSDSRRWSGRSDSRRCRSGSGGRRKDHCRSSYRRRAAFTTSTRSSSRLAFAGRTRESQSSDMCR